MPAVQYFYNGARYHFMDSRHPAVNWVTNNVCIGRKLIFHPDEPEDDLTKPYRVLKYLPIAIHVEPNGLPLGNLCGDGSPTNCIPVTPIKSARITVTFPHNTVIHPSTPAQEGREKRPSVVGSSIAVHRHGFMLESANVVTDYFAQGMSFRGKPNLLHVTPPPGQGQHINRGNLLVTVSRPSLKSELNLLTPLWRPGDDADKARVLKAVRAALIPSQDYLAEKARLQALSETTWDKHYERLLGAHSPRATPLSAPTTLPQAAPRPASAHHFAQAQPGPKCALPSCTPRPPAPPTLPSVSPSVRRIVKARANTASVVPNQSPHVASAPEVMRPHREPPAPVVAHQVGSPTQEEVAILSPQAHPSAAEEDTWKSVMDHQLNVDEILIK
jgi:hypothetical protein